MHIRINVHPDNPGNDDTRRAFVQRNGVWLRHTEELAEVMKVSLDMAYKVCKPLQEFGSGSPSVASFHNEILRTAALIDIAEKRETSYALEMANGSVRWVRQILNGWARPGDLARKMAEIVSHTARANQAVEGRQLSEMSINAMGEARDHLRALLTAAEEAAAMLDAGILDAERSFEGVPQIGDRKVRAG